MPEFQKTTRPEWFRKVMFGLCWFHAIVIERNKFKTLGWNVTYSFNDSDFSVCEDLLRNYMQVGKDEPIQWTAIQTLIADGNYGGRVSDDWDRRLINVYAEEIFNEKLVIEQRWKPPGTDTLNYQYINEEEMKGQAGIGESPYTPQYFFEDIGKNMESIDSPSAFGQHVNAEITSQIMDANSLLSDILSLQPLLDDTTEGTSKEESVLNMISELAESLPTRISLSEVKHKHKKDEGPLKVVLIQEIQRYNTLLVLLEKQFKQLEQGIQGKVLISPELEIVMSSLSEGRVPESWRFLYFSLKPLAAWIRDLHDRYDHFNVWAFKATPNVFWISAFTYPTGFTTALLQKFSRRPGSQVPIDQLEFEFPIDSRPINEIYEPPTQGAYIYGLYLEGARWEPGEDHLQEPKPMELYCAMPIIQLKPSARKSKNVETDIYGRKGDYYHCPTYYYPIRNGTIYRDSFIMSVDLKIGPNHTHEYWIKRGTALLMSLSD
jgi:dynein heavy chain